MNYKNFLQSLSTKKQTIILVLSIYIIISFVFFYIRYTDINNFAIKTQADELNKVKLIYKETLKRVKKFYITRGIANINSYGIKEAFIQNDKKALHELSLPRWNVIKKENIYLKSFAFYDKHGDLLTHFGEKPEEKLFFLNNSNKSFDGFWEDKHSFKYHAVAQAKDDKLKSIGYVVFIISPEYFLLEISKIINIDTYIVHSKKDASKSIFSINGDVLDIKDESHSVHTINSIGMDEKNNFEIIFLQDNSYRQKIIKKAILENLILLIILAIITASVINYGCNIILNDLDESNTKLKKSQDRLKILNKSLQLEVEKEIKLKLKKELEANEKERILLHQSKLASMGEMIGNIAHQWRQPLTELSLVLINMELYFERSKMTKEKFQIKVKEANEQISFMSKTIDDFRNFFSSGKKKEEYPISYVIDQVKNLTNASLSNNNITLKYKIDKDYKLNGYPNEVAQAFLNIINNARDKFINEKNTNSLINIHAFIENSKKYITIEDNAGGIIVEPIEKVFEPYYSTKHAKSGTGIGLYMTKSIIENNNNAKLSVHNSKNGAVFTIVF